jgi:hypothetical protein
MTDAVIAYLEGDTKQGLSKLSEAAAKNSPQKVKDFAERLKMLADLPGADGFSVQINELSMALLAGNQEVQVASASTAVSTAATNEPTTPTPSGGAPAKDDERRAIMDRAVMLALSAPVDFSRNLTMTSTVLGFGSGSFPCQSWGFTGVCIELDEGPIVVTNVIAARDCPDKLFIGTRASGVNNNWFTWIVEATPTGVQGTALNVAPAESLYLMQVASKKELSTDPRCAVTWSRYQPRLVPGKAY